jgi:inner membrane protein
MHRPGHYGAALLAYAPLGFLATALGFETAALVGGGVAVAGAMVPDWDQRVPFVRHRGPTHTVWFALGVGILLGAGGVLAGARTGALTAAAYGAFGFAVGVITVGAHLLADALTPMGIRPLEPVDDVEYSLEVTKAANPVANYLLLAVGVTAAGGAFVAAGAVATAVGG